MVGPNSQGLRSWIRGRSPLWPYSGIAAYSVCALAFWVRDYWRPQWDSGIYLVTARALANGEGYSYLGRPFFLRPPGFSWMLSFFAGGDRFDFHLLSFIMMGFAVGVVWAVFLVLKGRYGHWRAMAIAILTGTSPIFAAGFNAIMSDFPFLVLLLLGLSLLDWAALNKKWRLTSMVGGSLLLVGSAYLRTAALAALPGVFLVFFLRQRGWERLYGLVAVLITLALIMPWFYHARVVSAKAERPSDQLFLVNYTTAMFRVDTGDPGSGLVTPAMWQQRIKGNALCFMRDLAFTTTGTHSTWIGFGIVTAALFGLGINLRRNLSLLDLFTIFYVGVLLTYFVFSKRLLLTVLPLFYAYILVSLRFTLGRINRWISGSTALRAVEVAAVGFLLIVNLTALHGRLHSDQEQRKRGKGTRADVQEDYRRVADWFRNNTSETATALTGPAPILSVFADRRVYTSKFHSVDLVLARHKVDFAVCSWWTNRLHELDLKPYARSKWILDSSLAGESIRVYHLTDTGLLPHVDRGEILQRQVERRE